YMENGEWHFLVLRGEDEVFEFVSVIAETGSVDVLDIEARGEFDSAGGGLIPLSLFTYNQFYLYENALWQPVPFAELRDRYNVPIFTGTNWYVLEDSHLQAYPNGLQVIISEAEGYDDRFEHRSWFWLDGRWIEIAQD